MSPAARPHQRYNVTTLRPGKVPTERTGGTLKQAQPGSAQEERNNQAHQLLIADFLFRFTVYCGTACESMAPPNLWGPGGASDAGSQPPPRRLSHEGQTPKRPETSRWGLN
jgi:hypothetical protein